MRLGFGLFALALAIGACAEDKAVRLASQWGCGPVEGVKALGGEKAPAWILVGEFTETAEAPAAIADIACNLATSGEMLFVGIETYLGGASDAETRMLARLDALIGKGAPIVLARIGGEDHPYAVHNRDRAEKAWAQALTARVAAAGARRALLFVSRANAIASPIAPSGDRFAGYKPMPVFLEGGVISLEVAANPIPGAPGPAIRLHPAMKDGFSGQLALTRLTRPMIAIAMPEGRAPEERDPSSMLVPEQADRQSPIIAVHPDPATPPITEEERKAMLKQLLESLPRTPPP